MTCRQIENVALAELLKRAADVIADMNLEADQYAGTPTICKELERVADELLAED